jgi:hypothetical protein
MVFVTCELATTQVLVVRSSYALESTDHGLSSIFSRLGSIAVARA